MSRLLFCCGRLALGLALISQAGCGWILGLDEYSLGDACPVAECGVFVALEGSDTNEGTKDFPVRTVSRAIEIADKANHVVHLCAQEFVESLQIPPGIYLRGSLNCNGDWEGIGDLARTTIAPGPNKVPMVLLGGDAVTRLENIDARAGAASVAGGSSIAVIAEGGRVELEKCIFTAGDGAPGENGQTPVQNVGTIDNPKDPAIKGQDGAGACLGGGLGNPGGAGATNPLCMESVGGAGGKGGTVVISPDSGGDGAPADDPANDKGKGGAAEGSGVCVSGGFGRSGALGIHGMGASSIGLVSISGYAGSAGDAGGRGGTGQGGGGGGGAKGKLNCNGASGGGGGAGGCGGFGGLGGAAGGASIALISINSDIAFKDVKLIAARGAAGGDGGEGQNGGIGGSGGKSGIPSQGLLPACAGGDGGFGGLGGQGGGGRGGHSLGIAFTGKVPLVPATTIVVVGQPGPGGAGADDAGRGATGEAAATLEFPPPS